MKQAIEILHNAVEETRDDAGSMAISNTLLNAASYLLTGQIIAPRGVAYLWSNWEVK